MSDVKAALLTYGGLLLIVTGLLVFMVSHSPSPWAYSPLIAVGAACAYVGATTKGHRR